jgi:glycosyltransferase involved in cell wall biosynthesis
VGYFDVSSVAISQSVHSLVVKIILFANTDWYLYNFRRSLATALRDRGYEVILISPPGKYGACLIEAGFRWVPFSLSRRGSNPISELITIWRLIKFYKSEKPNIVHHFTIKCVLYGSLAAHLADVKTIVNSITGLGYVFIGRDWRARFMRWIVKHWYRFALQNTQVIFQNLDDQRLFLDYGLVKDNQIALVAGSGVDTSKFIPVPEPDGKVMVILPTRMLWDKGVAEFVGAARHLIKLGVEARFVLVGDTDTANPASVPTSKLEEWQQEGVVEWWGWQDDMISVYRRSHVICLPSYREGMPRVLIEAGACGKPVVATDVPGCRDVIQNGQNGLLVPVRDEQALTTALQEVIENQPLRILMGTRGRQIVEQKFSTNRIVNDTLDIYGRIQAFRGS